MRSPEPLNSDLNPRRGAIGMAWILLFVAGLFEAGMVVGLDFSEGFTRLWPSLLTLVSGGISFFLLAVHNQRLHHNSAGKTDQMLEVTPDGPWAVSVLASGKREQLRWAILLMSLCLFSCPSA